MNRRGAQDARRARIAEELGGAPGDIAFGAAVVGTALVALWIAGGADAGSAAAMAGILAAVCACAHAARRFPLTAVLVACPLLFGSAWLPQPAQDTAESMLLVAVFPLVYRLAVRTTPGRALAATVAAAGAWQAGGLSHSGAGAANPSILFSTIGACAVGLIVNARDRAHAALEAQARELAQAQQAYTDESVRYERTRIARELHDIVAHCLSAMVVQANAGQKLARRDPARAGEAFDHITQSAHQAANEIVRLVALLEPHSGPRSRSIAELVARARATGLAIDYRPPSDADSPDPTASDTASSDTAYAVVQEALTNALKHAPGAPIEVSVCADPERLAVVVTNGPPRAAGLDLAGTGGRHGLRGLRERVIAGGGTFAARASEDGGWRVAADLPARAAPE